MKAATLSGDSNHLLNVAFRYRTCPIHSYSFFRRLSILAPNKATSRSLASTDSWKLLGRINDDHSNERNLESFAGVEWSDCCATIRVIAREWVDENQLFVPNTNPIAEYLSNLRSTAWEISAAPASQPAGRRYSGLPGKRFMINVDFKETAQHAGLLLIGALICLFLTLPASAQQRVCSTKSSPSLTAMWCCRAN